MSTKRERRARGAALVLVLALFASGCSSDDEGDDPTEKGRAPGLEEPRVALVAKVGKVTGKLPPKRRTQAVSTVGRTVDKWFEAAWVGGDFPRRSMKGSWPGFTRDLATQARRDRTLTSNAQLAGRIDEVTVVRRTVKVDLLGASKRAVGATARFRLVFDTDGDARRRVTVTGRLTLSPVKGTWRIFEYDVARSARAVPASRKDN